MEYTGKISVIIPTYNSREYICEAIESVLRQSYKNYEIIVIDDGSTDDTVRLLDSKYRGLRIISQKNSGLATARNTGLKLAKGDYIQFLDADDTILPGKFEETITYFEKGYDVISCWCEEVSDDLIHIISTMKPFDEETNHYMEILDHNSIGVVHGPIFRHKILDNVNGMDESFGNYCADWNFWMRIIYLNYRIGIINKVLCQYRRHNMSLTSGSKYLNCVGDLKVVKSAKKLIQNNTQDSFHLMKLYNYSLGSKRLKCIEHAYRENRYIAFFTNIWHGMFNSFSRRKILNILIHRLHERK